jgi:hypothetical protein
LAFIPEIALQSTHWSAVQHLDQFALARTKEVEGNERGGLGFRYIVETNDPGAKGFVESVALLEDAALRPRL